MSMSLDILGWAGDKQLNYPAQLAKEVLERGVRIPLLRNEIYAQIIKQLTQNRNPVPYLIFVCNLKLTGSAGERHQVLAVASSVPHALPPFS